MKIAQNMTELIGHTPLLHFENFEKLNTLETTVLGKLECFNPAGSVKDRVALSMINNAEKSGKLTPDSVIIEPTSGNTGIGLASIARVKGYKLILTMPETMSIERRNLLKAYGAEIVLTEGSKGMAGAIAKANELAKETANSFIPSQFENPANPQAHFETTGPEIYADTDGKVDIFIAGIGTGGTVSGTGRYLKSQNPNVKIIGIEPESSPIITKGEKGPHAIQGIGAGFIPENFDSEVCDEVITITNEEAYAFGKSASLSEGILLGISSGAALAGAVKISQRPENKGKVIVALLPDGGEKYLSTPLFKD